MVGTQSVDHRARGPCAGQGQVRRGEVTAWGAHLCHHAREGPEAEHAQRDAHQVLRREEPGQGLLESHSHPSSRTPPTCRALTSWKKAEARNTPTLATHLLLPRRSMGL